MESKGKLHFSSFDLKILAILTMLIDHIGAVCFPELIIFRIIGRISFPIFAFLLAEGFFYTKDVKKYILRLFIFALITEPIFDFAFYRSFYYPDHNNILFTFAFAILILDLLVNYSFFSYKYNLRFIVKLSSSILAFILFIAAEYFRFDYGAIGLIMVFALYFLRDKRLLSVFAMVLTNFILAGLLVFKMGVYFSNLSQVFVILSIPFILLYNGEKGRDLKYIFYAFYPAHLLVLAIIKYYL